MFGIASGKRELYQKHVAFLQYIILGEGVSIADAIIETILNLESLEFFKVV
jgi:hypothetical protein